VSLNPLSGDEWAAISSGGLVGGFRSADITATTLAIQLQDADGAGRAEFVGASGPAPVDLNLEEQYRALIVRPGQRHR
jgi:hypothetical protein